MADGVRISAGVPVSVWRVEWWRLARTRRLVALLAVFVFFGFTGPLSSRYLGQLVSGANQQGITITVPPPVPADGISEYVGNALLIGLIVAVVIAAYACAIDANPALAAFYRSRTRSFRRLILPRVAVTAGAVIASYLTGLLVAWYETATLIGAPDPSAMLFTGLWGSAYLLVAVSVTAAAAALARGTLTTVGITLVVLTLFPLAGAVPALSRWVPSALIGAPEALLRHTAADHYQRALAVAVILCVAALALTAVRARRR
jgi:ABC-2 type transport system permease protein